MTKPKKDHLKYLRGALLKRFHCRAHPSSAYRRISINLHYPWYLGILGERQAYQRKVMILGFSIALRISPMLLRPMLSLSRSLGVKLLIRPDIMLIVTLSQKILSVIWAALSLPRAENCIKNLNSPHSGSSHSFSRSYCKIGWAKFGYFPSHEKQYVFQRSNYIYFFLSLK